MLMRSPMPTRVKWRGKNGAGGRRGGWRGNKVLDIAGLSLPLYSAESFFLGFRPDHDQAEKMYSRNTSSLATIQGVQEELQFTTPWRNET